jgi:hypothetical protein
VPFMSEIVLHSDISPFYLLMVGCVLPRSKTPSVPGLACYRLLSNDRQFIRSFGWGPLLTSRRSQFETCIAHQ